MPDEPDVEVLLYRIEHLEAIEKSLRHELHDVRTEIRTMLRTDYLTTEAMRNVFVTRSELSKMRAEGDRARREWPMILGGVIVAIASVGSLIVQLAH